MPPHRKQKTHTKNESGRSKQREENRKLAEGPGSLASNKLDSLCNCAPHNVAVSNLCRHCSVLRRVLAKWIRDFVYSTSSASDASKTSLRILDRKWRAHCFPRISRDMISIKGTTTIRASEFDSARGQTNQVGCSGSQERSRQYTTRGIYSSSPVDTAQTMSDLLVYVLTCLTPARAP